MGKLSGETEPREPGSQVGRRDFIRKAAIIGTGTFVVPTISTVEPADAQALTSPPPEPPGSSNGPGGAVTPTTTGGPPAASPVSRRTQLPRTGADIDRLVAAGLAATAGGAALVLWSADAQSPSAAPRPTDPEPER
jgi:hypothetical protein